MSDSHDPVAPEGTHSPLSQAAFPEAEAEIDQPEADEAEDYDEEDYDEEDDPAHNGHPDPALAFVPAGVRYRYDGWTPDKQMSFIGRLAESGCVDEAVRAVGMSRNSAYALRRRDDAQAFRLAWEAAQDHAIGRLNDVVLSRAIHGVAVPIFYQGEQIGERRQYDDRLAMFLLRYRDPTRYGRWLDRVESHQHHDGPALILMYRIARVVRAAWAALDAAWRGERPPPVEIESVRTAPSS